MRYTYPLKITSYPLEAITLAAWTPEALACIRPLVTPAPSPMAKRFLTPRVSSSSCAVEFDFNAV